MKLRQFIPVLIIAAGVAAYHNSFRGPFIYDDIASILENPHIRHLWPTGAAAPERVDRTVSGRPVVRLTLALNYAVGGLDVRGFHAFNLAVHLFSSLVLYGILRRTFEGEELRDRFGSTAIYLAAVISLIWEVHPLQTEVVTYIVQRTESLMGLFFLLTLYCFIRGVEGLVEDEGGRMKDGGAVGDERSTLNVQRSTINERGDEGKAELRSQEPGARSQETEFRSQGLEDRRRRGIGGTATAGNDRDSSASLRMTNEGGAVGRPAPNRQQEKERERGGSPAPNRQGRTWFVLSVAACALGMASKEVMVAAPLIVLVYDRAFVAASFRELWRRRKGWYIGFAATWLVLAVLVASTPRSTTRFDLRGLTPWNYLMTEAGVILYYLRLCFWPHPLVIDYFDWPIARLPQDALVAGLVVVGLLAATAWAFRRRPWVGFLGAWFFFILAPTSSILPSAGEAVAERRMYLPLAAVITLVVGSAFAFGRRLLSKEQGIVLGGLTGGLVVVLFTFLTIQRNQDYISALTIWQDAVEKRPNNARAHNNLGLALADAGKVQDATEHWEQALRLKPDFAEPHNNLGTSLREQGKLQEAISQYEQALQIDPDYAQAQYNWGNVLLRANKPQEAIEHYEQAVRTDPDLAEAHYNLGLALMGQGELQKAISHYQKALQIKPDYIQAQYNWGNALLRANQPQEAIEHYEQAVRIDPDYVPARNNLAAVLMGQGRLSEAISHLERVVRLTPEVAMAHYNLGFASEQAGQIQQAIQQYEQALRINADFVQAQSALARLHARQ